MTYDTPQGLRMGLEHRLRERADATRLSHDRLRRRVLFERIVTRLELAEPGEWVLKGGMALEVRIPDAARATKDIDLGLRSRVTNGTELHDRLIDALSIDAGDGFVFTISPPEAVTQEIGDRSTWRSAVSANLAGKPFGTIQLDVSPRPHELDHTERVQLPNTLSFAGKTTAKVEIIDVNRHAAEKFHAMLRDYGERENSRVRDLADLVILIERKALDAATVAARATDVWRERDDSDPPAEVPPLPESWPSHYEKLAADSGLTTQTFAAAETLVTRFWSEMFRSKEI